MGDAIAMGKATDLAAFARDAAADRSPRHMMHELAAHLPAQVFAPDDDCVPTAADRLRARLIGTPAHWALARRMAPTLSARDVVFATGEDVGIPLATLAADRGIRTAVYAHNLVRPRARTALRIFGAARRVAQWFILAPPQQALLKSLGVPAERICLMGEQTDTSFFTPGDAPPPAKPRPLIASVGLEQRDYRTLAAATADLNLDVRISGHSPDARTLERAFPTPLPANMTRRFYSWTELRALYRAADIVVVSLFDNTYAAGVTTLLEAAACGRPVIVTATAGLASHLWPDACVTVPPGDVPALRAAIDLLLADPARRDRLGRAAYAHAQRGHTPSVWLATVAGRLRALSPAPAPAHEPLTVGH